MTEPRLDDNARALLQTHLDSFEKLELVRVLRASGRPMSRSELETECRFIPDTVDEVLASLSHINAIEFDAAGQLVRLGPAAQDPAFQNLMMTYDDDRLAVLAML